MPSKKPQKIMVFGTFDGLHAGHQNFLQQASTLGSSLIVVIALDQNVQKIKNKISHFSEQIRLKTVQKHFPSAKVILGEREDFYSVIRLNQPDLIALGYDQEADLAKLQKEFPQVHVIRLKAYHPEKFKSSLINQF